MQTRVFKLGLRPPTEGAELVSEQIRLAHVYYNKLVEIERARREKARAVYEVYPNIATFQNEIALLDAEIEASREIIAKARKETRSRSEDPAIREQTRTLRSQLRDARANLRAAKSELKENPEVQAKFYEVHKEAALQVKQARASCGVYWGTYLLAEQAMDAARKSVLDPHFRRWDGSGAVAVQLQGGLSWEEALGCEDTRFRVALIDRVAWKAKLSANDKRQRLFRPGVHSPSTGWSASPNPTACKDRYRFGHVSLRVGSDGRAPVFAVWPLLQNRAIPEGAEIQWARVVRERLAGVDRWSLHLTLRLPDEWRIEPCGEGAVAVDLGWRQRENGLRVAFIRGHDGYTEEVVLPVAIIDRLRKVDDLRSIRDKRLDALKAWFPLWLTENKDKLPEWLVQLVANVEKWRSPARFSRVFHEWRERRFESDSDAFVRYQEWWVKDRHLWEWEANLRDKVIRRRQDFYRCLGAKLARRYKMLVLEAFDLREVQRHAAPESEKKEIQPARSQQRIASPSELRNALVGAFLSRGGEKSEEDPADTTGACHVCGLIEKWDRVTYVTHACTGCGATWDQDENACYNLLARYRDRIAAAPATAVEKKGSKWGRLGRHKKAEEPGDARGAAK